MCGIVGYVGHRNATPIVLSGLKRLEYRGYDSAGLAILEQNGEKSLPLLKVKRSVGKLDNLILDLQKAPLQGTSSIGHTRWATHGKPSERNAHPHRFEDVVIVHNGIIENYSQLREEFAKKGHKFSSETDSEVIAHILYSYIEETNNFERACEKLVSKLKGAFAVAALCARFPDMLFVAKQHCPMVLGIGKDEQFVASDIPALLEYTKDFIFLDDGELAFVTPRAYVVKTFAGKTVQRQIHHVNWSISVAEKEGYPHFMLKEIHEQPRVVRDTLLGRIQPKFDDVYFDRVSWKDKDWKKFKSISLVACGTAWHAGLIGKSWIERFARIHAEVDLASEFRYRNPVILKDSLLVPISQSGETADTIAALQEGHRLKMSSFAITNTVQSAIARKSKQVAYTQAGPEIAVASTKCFLAQLTVLALLAVRLAAANKSQSQKWVKQMLKDLTELPEKIEEALKLNSLTLEIAKKYSGYHQYFYLGRGLSNPIALEGALKLKEIAYINTQAYPAGEMKHGPIALISEEWPVVCVAPNDKYLEKMATNIEEVKARGGKLIIVGTEGNQRLQDLADEWIPIPEIREELSPFLSVVPLQLFAYHMSVLRGCDVDKPKNLAKSVTVE